MPMIDKSDVLIGFLPDAILHKISLLLDIDMRWKDVIDHLPPTFDEFEPKEIYTYTQLHVEMMEYHGSKANCSPTRILLRHLKRRRCRCKDLIKALEDSKLHSIASLLKLKKDETFGIDDGFLECFPVYQDKTLSEVQMKGIMENVVPSMHVLTEQGPAVDLQKYKKGECEDAHECTEDNQHEQWDIKEKKSQDETKHKGIFDWLKEAKADFNTENMILCRDSNEDDKVVIIGYDETISLSQINCQKIYHVPILLKHPRNVSDEALRVSTYGLENNVSLNEQENELLAKCIKTNSFKLWSLHSNLTMISGDALKCSNGKIEKRICVVLYCVSKGFVPVNEDKFPTYLECESGRVDVDVREGYFQLGPSTLSGALGGWNDPVCMGASIGEEDIKGYGSVGLFVDLPNNDKGFITCCHVLYEDFFQTPSIDKSYNDGDPLRTVLQPSLVDFCGKDIPERKCGSIKRAVFKPSTEPVSVDAALVQMTDRIPTTGHFVIRTKKQVTDTGFDENCYPLFNGGRVLRDISEHREKPLIKSGATTGLTKGEFKLNGCEVFISKDGAYLGDTTSYYPKRVMKGQYEVRSTSTFFDLGDSGSAVFVKNLDGSLQCVGLAIGKSSFNTTIVTPIGPVLDGLGLCDANVTKFAEPMHVG